MLLDKKKKSILIIFIFEYSSLVLYLSSSYSSKILKPISNIIYVDHLEKC